MFICICKLCSLSLSLKYIDWLSDWQSVKVTEAIVVVPKKEEEKETTCLVELYFQILSTVFWTKNADGTSIHRCFPSNITIQLTMF